MTDITKCKGLNCPIKESCHRYTSSEDEYQSYFLKEPFLIKEDKFTCDMYWGEGAQGIWNQLKNIVK